MQNNDFTPPESPDFSFLDLLFSTSETQGMQQTPQETPQPQSNISPQFIHVVNHLRTPLSPFVSVTTGRPHPNFPRNLFAYRLLTSTQLDDLFAHYHQVWPSVPETYMYPIAIPAHVVAEHHWEVDIEQKRRWFGRFIGLGGFDSRPIHIAIPDISGIFLDREETVQEILERIEREWQQALYRTKIQPLKQHLDTGNYGSGLCGSDFERYYADTHILQVAIYVPKIPSSHSRITLPTPDMASPPLVTHMYTADPSAHVFNDKLYIYPSHDRETDIQFNDNGDQYDMVDYHVLSMDSVPGPVKDHGVVLTAADVPWASKQLWAPDAATKDGKYYLYFPARDHDGIFRIGVAVADNPAGPFKAEPSYIPGSYSIDPASFVDEDADGRAYLYFGGIWGGQLQCWSQDAAGDWTVFDKTKQGPQEPAGSGQRALFPRVARLSEDMLSFDTPVRELQILDENGEPIAADDHERRFFEAAWMHKYNGKYYFSYSTGDTHYLAYAVGESPFGPFTYRGRILEPVKGWTTHHSICEFRGKWYLFYHDCELSGGVDHLRSVRMREIAHDEKGDIYLK
ncbi:glycosyl hydrolase [Aspergillus ambiguus]|uniref:glycoside hydrolase family 43 protein n=1 Tax=Aspergillus ambiguus TaxID=176160 RepID=UPI003CCC968C